MAKQVLGNNALGLPFSPAVAAGGFIFLSGQMAFDQNNQLVDGDITVQTKQVLTNIKNLLAEQGLTLDAVVKNTIWLTHVEDFAAFNQAYAEFFPNNPPARATVRSDLLIPGARIEIEALAIKD
ncbi:RidA family protein [Shewanella sp. 10N.286.48.B5]|uniref:RidA family protein n=1 Tax=Shewanella sp. 10N.286.48.B5 TaxID=1880834 RepID=UPI000C814BA6|nr:RidA family protein [Shewanella sp. 10N.286.48.B5]PMH84749.1 enamine deaminase RidA [Shewanella sp. 10N.286.48.B5]